MERLPPGQRWAPNIPVLHHGDIPKIDLEKWRFTVSGLAKLLELDWQGFIGLPRKKLITDWHCVTTWSVMDIEWEGVPFKEIARLVEPKPWAGFVMVHCYGGYSTNLPLKALLADDVIFAIRLNGKDLTPEHGWPMRVVVPARYAWKSAKWVKGVEFMEIDRAGFWEKRGYHNDGDPWEEERYSLQDARRKPRLVGGVKAS
jgi:DMSO/TMAO reductase YedYZ molybdopterin-dependent catalytic subunit